MDRGAWRARRELGIAEASRVSLSLATGRHVVTWTMGLKSDGRGASALPLTSSVNLDTVLTMCVCFLLLKRD